MMLSIDQLRSILPQSYPFLLIDKVLEFKEGESLVAIKNITANEWATQRHRTHDTGHKGKITLCTKYNVLGTEQEFPEVLLIESAAQAALVLYHVTKVKDGKQPQYLLGKVKAEYFSSVVVGDQLVIKVKANKIISTGAVAEAEIFVEEKLVSKVGLVLGVKRR